MKKPKGTPQKKSKAPQRLGTAASISAAASMTGLPIQALQSAKARGCPAFRSNKSVDCDGLIEWIANQPEQDGSIPDYFVERALEKRADRKLKEQKLRERDKLVWPIAKIKSAWTRNVIACKTKLATSENAVAVEVAMKLNLSADQVATLKEIHTKHNRLALKELFAGEFGKVECPGCGKEIKE